MRRVGCVTAKAKAGGSPGVVGTLIALSRDPLAGGKIKPKGNLYEIWNDPSVNVDTGFVSPLVLAQVAVGAAQDLRDTDKAEYEVERAEGVGVRE